MRVGETVLVPNSVTAEPVLTIVARFPHATVLRAAAPGRRHFVAYAETPRCTECNPMRAPEWDLVVENAASDVLTVTALDSRLNIRVSLGQRLEIAMDNFPNQPAWATLDTKDTAVLVPAGPAVITSSGIHRGFTAGAPGTAFVALCPVGGCPDNYVAIWWRFIVGD